MFEGTYKANRRPVETTAPDCLVYIQGELSLPSGANPYRRINIQPLINSVSVNVGLDGGSASASIDLHIPRHYLDDIFVGGQLSITTMMEVQIYMKGQFTVGGAGQFYPVFWGITTSVSENYSAGEHTVSISCSDILYWWENQQININPSWLGARKDQTQQFNLEGNYFTKKNPYSIMYTLARRVYGDSMNVRNMGVPGTGFRSEAPESQRRRLMAYWSRRWGRIGQSLRMFGPTGQVLQGDLLQFAIDPRKFRRSKAGSAAKIDGRFYDAFQQGDIDFSQVSPFALVFSQLQSLELYNSEFETRLGIANQVKEAIGYEFFMDVTGELIFKPPFYNLDVRPNFPVSWIRDIDVISWGFAENPPDATFIEATGFQFGDQRVGLADEIQPKATYVDYRLVQKYGWKPGSFSSEYIGSRDFGGSKALFYHLVDILDKQNARVNNGTATIPLRPELRLGYPVYVEGKDAYYYLESLSHTFSYGSRCTTQATLMARRQKFYADFGSWNKENLEPKPGDTADPGLIPQNMYKRPIDPTSGTPVGDRNVILAYQPSKDLEADHGEVKTFDEQGDNDAAGALRRDLVDLRSQFGTSGPNKYVFKIDPNRDKPYRSNDTNERSSGPVTHIEDDRQKDIEDDRPITVNAVILPVSDERGYEVIGGYEYGRRVTLGTEGFVYDKDETDIRVDGLLTMQPQNQRGGTTTQNLNPDLSNRAATAQKANVQKDKTFLIDPNNYGRLLTEVRPPEITSHDLVGLARLEATELVSKLQKQRLEGATPSTPSRPDTPPSEQGISRTSTSAQSIWGRTFRYNSNVAAWRTTIRSVRSEFGYSEETYSDETLLAIIHTESAGNANARRTNKDGKLSQFVGLFQIGKDNASDEGRKNTDFAGNGALSIQHFLEYQDAYKDRHQGDPRKQAILWKAGPGALDAYNRQEAAGASTQALENWLANYPPSKEKKWGVDEYASRVKAAAQVWTDAITGDPSPSEDEAKAIEDAASNSTAAPPVPEDNGIKGSATIADEADDPVASQVVNTVGLPVVESDIEQQVELFENRLEENLAAGINALPADLKPPRDPSVVPIITNFLRSIYADAFQVGKSREAELRGETRRIPRVPDAASIPTETPPRKTFVDTPLSRSEIAEALEEGQTYQDLFQEGGAVRNLRESFEDVETASSNLLDAADALSQLGSDDDEEG